MSDWSGENQNNIATERIKALRQPGNSLFRALTLRVRWFFIDLIPFCKKLLSAPCSPLSVTRWELSRRTLDNSLLLVTLTNEGYLPYTRNLLASLEKTGLGKQMLVFCIDDASCRALRAEGILAYRVDYNGAASGFQRFHQGEFRAVAATKLSVIHELLKLRFKVLFSDGDIVFLDNPIPQMLTSLEKADLVIQNDDKHDTVERDSLQISLCTGFLLIRPTPHTLRSFNPDNMNAEDACDQAYFNRIKSGVGSITVLDRHLFPNGSWFLDSPGNDYEARKARAQMIHFNWRIGEEKLEAMKAHGLWFIGENP